jgi:bleomycin hydrolase
MPKIKTRSQARNKTLPYTVVSQPPKVKIVHETREQIAAETASEITKFIQRTIKTTNDDVYKKLLDVTLNEGWDITCDSLSKYSDAYRNDKNQSARTNAISSTSIDVLAENRDYNQMINRSYSNSLKRVPAVTSQAYSGRCWMFAALNAMRYHIINEFNLNDYFELSEAYLFFWDKLERSGSFLEQSITFRYLDNSDPRWIFHLSNSGPKTDGGTWCAFTNLVRKYGVVPKTIYGESYNSSCSDEMNQILGKKMEIYVSRIRKLRRLSAERLRKIVHQEMLPEIYRLLCNFMGEPPHPHTEVKWCFHEASENVDSTRQRGAYHEIDITPMMFYEKCMESYDVEKMVLLRHDPRNDVNHCYQVDGTAMSVGGTHNIAFNVSWDVLSQAAVNSIKGNDPVWFDCDVMKHFNPWENVAALEGYNYEALLDTDLEVSKEEGLCLYSGCPSHAMSFVGVDIDDQNNVRKWKVENSWGDTDDKEDPGYILMTGKWFERHGYEIAVKLEYLPKDLQEIYKQEVKKPRMLLYNDAFGAVALKTLNYSDIRKMREPFKRRRGT